MRLSKPFKQTPAMAAGLTNRLYEMNLLVDLVEGLRAAPGPRGPYKTHTLAMAAQPLGGNELAYQKTATVEVESVKSHPQGWEVRFVFKGMGRDFAVTEIVGTSEGEDTGVRIGWKILGDRIIGTTY